MTKEISDRDLDALVAERFGFELIAPCLGQHSTDEDVWCYNCRQLVDEVAKEPPRFSTDIASAMLVVEKMRERGWDVALTSLSVSSKWGVSFIARNGSSARYFKEEAESLPKAITLAALEAVKEKADSRDTDSV